MVRMRFVFRTKWNHAQPVIDGLKRSAARAKEKMGVEIRVLSDLTGPMHTIIQEADIESMAEWERARGELMGDPEFRQDMEEFSQFIEHGSLEFYTIEM